ncbi:MAG: 2Fe-2S iron-sulfur cluster-binding protein [Bacteroidota bacterium]
MIRIVIKNLHQKVLEARDPSKTLLQHFHDHHLDWMHACGGKGRCTTCKVCIIDGEENFSSPTGPELKYKLLGALGGNERLSCQARVHGEVHIIAPREYKLPHLSYSDD